MEASEISFSSTGTWSSYGSRMSFVCIPVLIKASAAAGEATACGAIEVLALFRVDAEHVIPALTNTMAGNNPTVASRELSASGLSNSLARNKLSQC